MQLTHSFSVRVALRRAVAGTALALLGGGAAAMPVSSFTINVPHRPLPQLEISALKITLQLDSSANIALQVSEAGSGTRATQDMVLTNNANDCFAGAVCFSDLPNTPAGAVQVDRLTVIKPMQAAAAAVSDPTWAANDKVVLLLRLRSNLNEGSGCVPTTAAPETWTVSVVGGAARITAVSVQSLDKNTTGVGNPACGTSFRPIPLNDLPLATVTGQAQLLSGGRVGVDAVMVLDRSGSMSSPVSADVGAPSKMVRLGEATDTFIDMWAMLRANECTNFAVNCPASGPNPGIQAPTDRLGVVFFDDAFNWLQTLRPASGINGLKDISTLNLATEKTEIKAVGPNGWTSIGGGLNLAAPALAPAAIPPGEPNRKVILLMTDGYQNTQPLVSVAGTQVQLDSGCATPPCALVNQPPIQIYGVTVGTGIAVDPTVNQQVSDASDGFYLNTEDDATILPNLFVQVLQNAIKFSSVETLRIVKGTTRSSAPFTTQVPVSTGTRSMAFNLNWPRALGALRVRLTPPGGGTPVDFQPGIVSTPGMLVGNIAFPRQGIPITAGTWTVTISPVGNAADRPVSFDFSLLGEDNTISSSLVTATVMPAVGGSIKLAARVNDFDKALLGLGTQPGAQVQVFVARPGVNLGDLLSDSAAQPVPAGPTDPGSAAERKLAAILAANPNALVKANDIVTLRDDGSAASGDSVANDGTYSALVPADVEGHYNFIYLIQGTSESGGAFVRQAIRTVHVRSTPSEGNTSYTMQTVGSGDLQALSVVMTPRNVKGGKMGPGYANYFWFASPSRPPVKPVDNLDGTYTARIPFSGTTPPEVTVHFLNQPVKRPDSYVPKPGDLNAGNTVTPVVGGGTRKYAIWGGAGITIPHNSFGNTNETGQAIALGFEYALNNTVSVEATLSGNRLDGKGANADVDVTQLGVNGKWYFTQQPLRFFATAGVGAYAFDPGSTRFGGSVGAGLQYQFTSHWALEVRYALHGVANNSPQTTFSTLLLALRYAF